MDQFPSELRKDPLSGDWVVVATARAKRPEMFKKTAKTAVDDSVNCPFCAVERMPEPKAVFIGAKEANFSGYQVPSDWTALVVPNKFPAVWPYPEAQALVEDDFFEKMPAVGHHEVIVLRDHHTPIVKLTTPQMQELISIYQQRYRALSQEKFAKHIAIFHNQGPSAGASINHPHSQIITTPLLDADLMREIHTSDSYYQQHSQCLYCQINERELKINRRVVVQNDDFAAICPFASKAAFEVVIAPKKHLSHFENASATELNSLAQILQTVLVKIDQGLGGVDYNFYLHTAPTDHQDYRYYHWHWTIVPKTSIAAGFEIGSRMEISTIAPEAAAEYLGGM